MVTNMHASRARASRLSLLGLQGGSCGCLGRQLRLPPQLRLCHGAQRARAVVLASLRKAAALHIPLTANLLNKHCSLGSRPACRSWKYPNPALACSAPSHVCRAYGAGAQARGGFRFRFRADRAPGLARGQPHALRVYVAGGRRGAPVGRRHHRLAALPGGQHLCRQRPCSMMRNKYSLRLKQTAGGGTAGSLCFMSRPLRPVALQQSGIPVH